MFVDETHHRVTGWAECIGSTNIHFIIVPFMKNSDVIFAVILKKKQCSQRKQINDVIFV